MEMTDNNLNKQKESFEVHTMPQKFLSTRPVFKATSKKKSHKKFGLKTNLIIGLIVIIVFAGLMILAAWLFLRSFNKPNKTTAPVLDKIQVTATKKDSMDAPLATTTLDNLEQQQHLKDLLDISKWQEYKNDQYYYSFKFPSSWHKDIAAMATTTKESIIIKDEDNKEYFKLSILTANKLNLTEWLAQQSIPAEDLKPFTLDGQVGYEIEQDNEFYSVYILYQQLIYKLSFIKSDDNFIKQLNNKILVSFKFIEVKQTEESQDNNTTALIYVSAIDSDHDGLTDAEEILYGSDKLKRDTDGDSYIDGDEISNLFHPAVAGSTKIYESDKVSTYVNADYNYNLIYPSSWTVKDNKDSVIFQSDTGEFIQVLILTNDKNYTDIINWYKANINLDTSDLTTTKVSDIPAIRTANGYNVYFLLGNNIYTLLYNINLRHDANFMTTFDMVIKSFKLMGNR